jgi:hypothetical protein
MRVCIKSLPSVAVYPSNESKFTSDVLNLQILPTIRAMGLPHFSRPYSEKDARELCETYIAHGCDAEVVE